MSRLIETVLELVRKRLDAAFQAANPRADGWVVLSNIIDQDGKPIDACQNKLVMTLANIEQDHTVSTWKPAKPGTDTRYSVVSPPVYVNLLVAFYANFSNANYRDGLGMISETIAFFQQNTAFTQQTLPGLDPCVDKVVPELTSLRITEMNYLMGMLGAKYLPTVAYKFRMLPFASDAPMGVVEGVRGLRDSQSNS